MNPRRTIGRRKIDRFRFAAGMGFALCLAGLILQLSRCNTGTTVTGPEKTPEVSTPSTQPAATTPAPTTPVADPTTTPDHECRIGANASWWIKNTSNIRQQYVAWWTDFDNQSLPRGSEGPRQFNPGDYFEGSFNKTCVQIDVGQTLNGTPFCFGYINHEGKVVHPSQLDRAKCNAKPCVEPRETPTTPGAFSWAPDILEGQCEQEVGPVGVDAVAPALNCHQIGTQKWTVDYQCREDGEKIVDLCRNVACPCVEQWIEQAPIITTGEWSACVLGTRSRTIRTVINEINSCSQASRVKSDTTRTETEDCQTPGHCYYKVSGGNEVYKKLHCEAAPGFPFFGGGGIWINFDGSKLDNHCDIGFPGISQVDFQLTPGQSAQGCLNKND